MAKIQINNIATTASSVAKIKFDADVNSLKPSADMNAKVVIILGMHRSGTSVLTRAVQTMGFELGKQLIEPNDENIKGFYENKEIVSFNDRLLCHADLSWDSIGFVWDEDFNDEKYSGFIEEAHLILKRNFSNSHFWAIKDPRLCILLPFWQKVLKDFEETGIEVFYILCLRNPLESYYSQRRRNELDPSFHIVGSNLEAFFLLWYTYIRKAVASIISKKCLCVSYERLLDMSNYEYQRIAAYLGIKQDSNLTDKFTSFIEGRLRRNWASVEEFTTRTESMRFVRDLYLGLKRQDTGCAVSEKHLREIITSTKGFDELGDLYLTNAQRLYGKLYHQHLSTRNMLGLEKEAKSALEKKLYATESLYNNTINSIRWRFISAVCRVFGR